MSNEHKLSLPVLYVRQQDLDWAQKAKAEISMGARYAPLNEYTVGLIDQAHLAPLQAELTRMNAQFDELAAAVGFTKERCEQTGDSPLDCANQLSAGLARQIAMANDFASKWSGAQTLSVTNIMLDVVPGEDGMGEEVYAQSVKDVEATLTRLRGQLEDAEDERDRRKARSDELEGLLREMRNENYTRLKDIANMHDRVDAALSKPSGSEKA